jgi:hypothetical protein
LRLRSKAFRNRSSRESSLIVDQLAASIISLPAQGFAISRKRKGFDWKTFAGLGRKSYGNQ